MDEIDSLVASLTVVADDLEAVMNGEDPYVNSTHEVNGEYTQTQRGWVLSEFYTTCSF